MHMDTFLSPIEKPRGLMMKLAYYFTRRQFGKVLTPLKVHSARLPAAFGLFYSKIGQLDKKLLPPETSCSSANRCAHQRLPFLHGYWPVVHDQSVNEPSQIRCAGPIPHERSLHRCRARGIGLCDGVDQGKKVNPETFARLSRHYSEREICEIVWLVASEHLYNMTNIGLNIHSDMLCDIRRKRQQRAA